MKQFIPFDLNGSVSQCHVLLSGHRFEFEYVIIECDRLIAAVLSQFINHALCLLSLIEHIIAYTIDEGYN